MAKIEIRRAGSDGAQLFLSGGWTLEESLPEVADLAGRPLSRQQLSDAVDSGRALELFEGSLNGATARMTEHDHQRRTKTLDREFDAADL